eukprot:m.153950 g.153950  ORF g.153950 m.153950 type:complete len:110 (-) comp23480_c0_seq1:70-399(-)
MPHHTRPTASSSHPSATESNNQEKARFLLADVLPLTRISLVPGDTTGDVLSISSHPLCLFLVALSAPFGGGKAHKKAPRYTHQRCDLCPLYCISTIPKEIHILRTSTPP